MKLRILITAALLSLALPAGADFTVVQEAYEVALSNLRLPLSESGTVMFRECDSCDYVTLDVAADTVYRIDGQVLPLARFRDTVARVPDRDHVPVTVLHHLERNEVTGISVSL